MPSKNGFFIVKSLLSRDNIGVNAKSRNFISCFGETCPWELTMHKLKEYGCNRNPFQHLTNTQFFLMSLLLEIVSISPLIV